MQECWAGARGAKRDLAEGTSGYLAALAYLGKFRVLSLRDTSKGGPLHGAGGGGVIVLWNLVQNCSDPQGDRPF